MFGQTNIGAGLMAFPNEPMNWGEALHQLWQNSLKQQIVSPRPNKLKINHNNHPLSRRKANITKMLPGKDEYFL